MKKNYFDYLENIKKENKKTMNFHQMTVINNFYVNLHIELKNENTLGKTIRLVPELLQHVDYVNKSNKYDLLDDIRKNKKIIKIGLEQCGSHIRYLSDELKNDKELVIVAITQNANSIQYLSNELKDDIELAYMVAKKMD